MTERAKLISLVEALTDARVFCLGDVMLDTFVYGQVERISPEAPIPVLRVTDEARMLGGAGNVVRNLAALGAGTRFLSVVGDDAAGGEVRALLAREPGVDSELHTDPGRRTTIKTRFIAGTQQMLRADHESGQAAGAEVQERIAAAAEAAVQGHKVVVLSDYGKGVLADATLARVIAAAAAAGATVVVDPKGRDYGRYRGAGILTPNLKELAAATGRAVATEDEIVAAARGLIDGLGLTAVLVTRSRDGMTLVPAEGPVAHLEAEAREVFDVSGAGDTVVATLAACLAAGAELHRAAALANLAAGIVVAKVGTAVAYAGDLIAQLHHQDLSEAEAKVLTLEQVLDRAAGWRRRGLRIGFTNGCFDLLHPGHVSLLRQARAQCDRLVVGLNSDVSVKRLKGEDRPVQGEAARAAVLACLTGVDAVVLFAEDTPLKLIEALTPDVLVKGADYRIDQVVGREAVEAAGGRVHLADLEPGHSTTATIKRLAGQG
ncbi:MAG: bifunctional heptose 7-phosphate kinase/heptose 1-phosphate adenyltransferase [Rhodospirillales bacterium CG15_BIG_FIL_POST_REV_8_21_14_020_66_15]|nr:MAG: bifunctional heptose 7-phosphate kinase/heptose 1-phosphate adenyltransferase [Rhodospirillales bacterium CG15_BIG_FIL_POST_REV_8_21_14_020_66_15]